jgi:hypothetical protein
MNINNKNRLFIYFSVLIILTYLLVQEYLYIHPYNPGMGWLGPRWKYESTKTILWWFLLFASIVLITPLLRKQKIGILGLLLFIGVIIRPQVQNKFPEETIKEFYAKRQGKFESLIQKTKNKNQVLTDKNILDLGFEKLIIKDSIYYFFFYDENLPFGICYSPKNQLDNEAFGLNIDYIKFKENWYELN